MTTRDEDLAELKGAIERHCIDVLPEPVQLASGDWSNYYCDLRLLTLHPRYAKLLGETMAPAVLESGAQAVGGMAMGCIPLADAIARAALDAGRVLPTFFSRPQQKDHGPQAKGALTQAFAEDGGPLVRPGLRVAIVEDTVTRGGSALRAVEAARAEGCEVVLVFCIVERHEGGGALFRERGIPFRRLFFTREDGSLHGDEARSSIAR